MAKITISHDTRQRCDTRNIFELPNLQGYSRTNQYSCLNSKRVSSLFNQNFKIFFDIHNPWFSYQIQLPYEIAILSHSLANLAVKLLNKNSETVWILNVFVNMYISSTCIYYLQIIKRIRLNFSSIILKSILNSTTARQYN